MSSDKGFSARVAVLRATDKEQPLKREDAYRNGQLLADGDDVSTWDNFDRYFKFYNVYAE